MMPRSIFTVIAAAVLTACFPCRAEPEIRTYQFVPDGSLPYSMSCGECAPPYLGARADIQGTFTLRFDLAAETSSFDALNDQLVNYFDLVSSPGGPMLVPSTPPDNLGIIPPAFASAYDPPYNAAIEIHISGDPVIMTSDFGGAPSFNIFMTGNQATFSMVVPIDDFFITVENAKAILIPEPGVAVPTVLAAATAFFRRRRRH